MWGLCLKAEGVLHHDVIWHRWRVCSLNVSFPCWDLYLAGVKLCVLGHTAVSLHSNMWIIKFTHWVCRAFVCMTLHMFTFTDCLYMPSFTNIPVHKPSSLLDEVGGGQQQQQHRCVFFNFLYWGNYAAEWCVHWCCSVWMGGVKGGTRIAWHSLMSTQRLCQSFVSPSSCLSCSLHSSSFWSNPEACCCFISKTLKVSDSIDTNILPCFPCQSK